LVVVKVGIAPQQAILGIDRKDCSEGSRIRARGEIGILDANLSRELTGGRTCVGKQLAVDETVYDGIVAAVGRLATAKISVLPFEDAIALLFEINGQNERVTIDK
jgi:hypothetical protein